MSLRSLAIGGITIAPNLLLAPMSGVTCSCFRRLIKRENNGAVGLLVTEFISIEGMTRRNEQSLRMMRFREEERPLSVQIFGNDIDRMVEAAKMVEDAGADILDINSGCPVPKVVKRGGGCELMRRPEHLAKVLAAVSSAISIPLTLKIRAGWDHEHRNALEIAKVAEENGVVMLAVHGRTRTEGYRGEADWDLIGEIAARLSIPVVGSGDVVDYESAKRRMGYGVAGLMVGRAALANPWVFSEIAAGFAGTPWTPPPPVATAEVIDRYLSMLTQELPEKAIIGRLKQISSQVTRRVRGSQSVRKALCMAKDVDEFRNLLYRWRDELACGSDEWSAALLANADGELSADAMNP